MIELTPQCVAFRPEQNTTKKTELFTHVEPHLDESLPLGLMQKWFPEEAERVWPGSSTASLNFLTTGIILNGKTEDDYQNRLFIGCGKGKLDEHHPTHGKRDNCAAGLVVKAMKLRVHEVDFLVHHIKQEDRSGGGVMHTASILKLIYRMENPPEIPGIIEWSWDAFAAEMNAYTKGWDHKNDPFNVRRIHSFQKRLGMPDAERWLELGMQALEECGKRQGVARDFIRDIKPQVIQTKLGPKKLVIVEDGNDQVAGRFWERGDDIMIKRTTDTGNVQIMTRTNSGLSLEKVAALIRVREAAVHGVTLRNNQKYLEATDTLMEEPRWHLVLTKDIRTMLFNGSFTAPGVEPTSLTLDEIIELVTLGLK